jgi:hypothetical protein
MSSAAHEARKIAIPGITGGRIEGNAINAIRSPRVRAALASTTLALLAGEEEGR